MRILFVSDRCPWPPDNGTRQRLYHVLEALASRHRVTLVAPADPDGGPRPPLADRFERVVEVVRGDADRQYRRGRFRFWASPFERAVALMSSPLPNSVRENWDHAVLDGLQQLRREGASFDAVWAVRPHSAEVAKSAGFEPIVVDVDDVETVKMQRVLEHTLWYWSKPLHYAELAKLRRYERSLPRRFLRAIVCKDEDRGLFPDGGRGVVVVPNGVSRLPQADPGLAEDGELLFVGTMLYGPNIEAVEWFHGAILPLIAASEPDVVFRIVGRLPTPAVRRLHDGSRCFVHADVPDVGGYFERAAVVVAPIRLGSGTRLKVLEALARGKALVATSTAVEGLDLQAGVDFELAEKPEQFAAVTVGLLRDEGRRRQLGESGRQRVLERYTWDAIEAMVLRAIEL